ncbi:MAG: recombinase RmuC [Candidatus Omnitrophica bacterium CG11_big_fil_rev_8_21_14_0_20_42_13]|uniref:Recombinase RmuC n=1 Tax=Candidatus Ghiorseimicrobium undicola TaxID=1974746 RepID=A0A2H0LZE4_9BACT|nr:MAG: recombinase RmuC [Candidatus Omnitrophica bacterium CG11_big_fil_rev_8_21_14_0_20_42_13]
MNLFIFIIAVSIGISVGVVVAFILRAGDKRKIKEIAQELSRENEAQRRADIDAVIENVKANFGKLSLDALSKSTEELLKLAGSKLDTQRQLNIQEMERNKGLIDQQLVRMSAELESVSELVRCLERDREQKFGELTNQLKMTNEQSVLLMQVTSSLREALSGTKSRGQWGERIAEDVLRIAGFIENINYLKQKTIENAGSRPDFTFLLPRNLKLNMDVKFPWDNYVKFLESESDTDKLKYRDDFLRDVRAKIKEVTSREYINPEQDTVDYALLFIPNEQVYAFIHEQDSSILDTGIKNRVIFCSPVTLYAVLAVIRQAVDNFSLEQTSNEILSLLGMFKKQWVEFLKKLESLGKKIEDAQKDYEALTTTRQRQLEKPLNKIESLRTQKKLPIADFPGEDQFSASEEIKEGGKEAYEGK